MKFGIIINDKITHKLLTNIFYKLRIIKMATLKNFEIVLCLGNLQRWKLHTETR